MRVSLNDMLYFVVDAFRFGVHQENIFPNVEKVVSSNVLNKARNSGPIALWEKLD